MVDEVLFEVDGDGVGLLTVNRPQVHNALSWSAMEAFVHQVEQAHSNESLRALIVTGAGKSFVAGGDLRELHQYPTREDAVRLTALMGNALARLEQLPCPVIAAIGGAARGGGAEIALACDLRIMAEDADIGFVHGRLGLIPGWGGSQRLLRAVGYATAMELLVTARVIDPDEALALRLVNQVVGPGQALDVALDWAQSIAKRSVAAVRAAKQVLRLSMESSQGEVELAERAAFLPLWHSDFHRSAVKRFIDKNG